MNALELTGRARSHLGAPDAGGMALHADVARPFARLCAAAGAAGFALRPVSSFRDFDRQLSIWNAKFTGRKPLLDAAGREVDAHRLSPDERVEAILVWSALPGASRHHWGTDLDLVDGAAVDAGHRVRLTADEFGPGGPFEPLSDWLEHHAARFGFFRPFRGVLSGVQSEPWHYSFAPVAEPARRALTVDLLRAALESAALEGRKAVMERLASLHTRYVAGIDWP